MTGSFWLALMTCFVAYIHLKFDAYQQWKSRKAATKTIRHELSPSQCDSSDQQDEAGSVTPGVGVVWKQLNSHWKSERDVIWWEIRRGRCTVRSRLWNPACVWGFCIHCRITVCSKGHYISKTLNICSNGNIYFNTLYSICFCTSVRGYPPYDDWQPCAEVIKQLILLSVRT